MSDIYYNVGESPIFITLKYKADPNGGPAKPTQTICIAPGQGIDLAITPLRRRETDS